MPRRLRPTAPNAADAILVGDPGRALLLAQELLAAPKMSNHARGLWGYTGETPEGQALTIQATGMGGPSAALVLEDLAELGVGRAVRVGSCLGTEPGRLLLVGRALAGGAGEGVLPDPGLTERLGRALGEEFEAVDVASLDRLEASAADVAATDMQTAAVLARSRGLGIAAAAVLVVVEDASGGSLDTETREGAERRAGRAAAHALSP